MDVKLNGLTAKTKPSSGLYSRRLLAQQLVAEVRVVPPEVDGLDGRVDLRLVDGLRLPQHRRCVDGVPPGTGQQRSSPQQHSGSLLVGGRGPGPPRFEGGVDGVVEIFVRADGVLGDGQLVSVRRADVAPRSAPSPLAPDLHGDLGACVGQLGQAGLQARPLGVARRVCAHRFVDWSRDLEMSVGGHVSSWC